MLFVEVLLVLSSTPKSTLNDLLGVTIIKYLYTQVDVFTSIYKKLTGKDVTFEFPQYD